MRKWTPWTNEEIEELKRLKEAGISKAEICRRLDRPRSSLNSKIKQIKSGVVSNARNWSLQELSLLQELFIKGMTRKEIAKQVGRSEAATNTKINMLRSKIWDREAFKQGDIKEENMEIVKGVVIPTLTSGTAEEEKEKALYSLENRISKQREDFEYLKDRYRGIYHAVSTQDLNLKIQRAEIKALKSRVYLALAVLVAADAVFIMTLAKMLIK